MNCTIFEKKLWNIRVLVSSTILPATFLIPRKTARYNKKCILVCLSKIHHSSQIVMKLEFSGQIFGKSSKQISWTPFQWEPRCSTRTDRRADRRTATSDKANSRVSQFCQRVQKRCNSSKFSTKWLHAKLCTLYQRQHKIWICKTKFQFKLK